MADLTETFAQWQKLVGQDGDPWESEDDLMFLFDFLPHTGERLDQICQGHPHGEEVLQRLQRFFRDAAEPGSDEGESTFSQNKVPRKSDAEIQALLLQHAANMREMALLCADDPDEDDIVKCIGNPPVLTRVDSSDDIEADDEIEVLLASDLPWLFDDKVAKADNDDNPLEHLTEALYHSAWNHYAVANYVQWPLRRGESSLADPYLPAYELWLQNVLFRYTANGQIAYTVEDD